MTTPATETQPATRDDVVIARAGRYFRNARYLMVTLVVGLGGYFLYDGYIGYPAANEKHRKENLEPDGTFKGKPKHSDTDILLQKVLGYIMPPLGLAYLAFILHKSRGAYRMEGDTISIPGHPTFRLSEITAIDRRHWDRKGIAHIEYKTATGQTGRATIDDFIYDRPPTHKIYDAIMAELASRETTTTTTESA